VIVETKCCSGGTSFNLLSSRRDGNGLKMLMIVSVSNRYIPVPVVSAALIEPFNGLGNLRKTFPFADQIGQPFPLFRLGQGL
jgi:hypothetical protein